MLFKKDWDRCRIEYELWWRRENKTPLLVFQDGAVQANPVRIKNFIDMGSTDYDTLIDEAEERFANTTFLGESFPLFCPSFAAGEVAAYLGIEPEFEKDSVWLTSPIIKNWEEAQRIDFNPENKWWKIITGLMRRTCERAKGKFVVGFPDLGGSPDILASMRGNEALLMDLTGEHAEEVKLFSKRLLKLWHRYYNDLYQILKEYQDGTCGWLPAWSRRKTYPLQCDFSAMISPEMYKEFFLPLIIDQVNLLDDAVYHLDGPGGARHLDMILDVPAIKAIEWVPGYPYIRHAPPTSTWLSMLRHIQSKNKALYLYANEAGEADILMRNLAPQGLLIEAHCSLKDAEELLKMRDQMRGAIINTGRTRWLKA